MGPRFSRAGWKTAQGNHPVCLGNCFRGHGAGLSRSNPTRVTSMLPSRGGRAGAGRLPRARPAGGGDPVSARISLPTGPSLGGTREGLLSRPGFGWRFLAEGMWVRAVSWVGNRAKTPGVFGAGCLYLEPDGHQASLGLAVMSSVQLGHSVPTSLRRTQPTDPALSQGAAPCLHRTH